MAKWARVRGHPAALTPAGKPEQEATALLGHHEWGLLELGEHVGHPNTADPGG